MKFGVSLILWTSKFDRSKMDLLPLVSSLGYDGVELPIRNIEEVDVDGTKEALEKNGLQCTVCPQVTKERSLIRASTHKEAIAYFAAVIKLTSKLRGHVIGGAFYTDVGVGKSKNPRTKEEWDFAVKGLRELARVAEDYDVTLALEPITRFETHFLNTAEDTVRLIEEIGHPRVGVNLDIFHMYMEEKELTGVIRKTGRHLAHVHAAENNRGIPGNGLTNWGEIGKALHEVSYEKWIVFETLVPAVEELVTGGCLWRDPLGGKTREEAARESLAHLKKYLM